MLTTFELLVTPINISMNVQYFGSVCDVDLGSYRLWIDIVKLRVIFLIFFTKYTQKRPATSGIKMNIINTRKFQKLILHS